MRRNQSFEKETVSECSIDDTKSLFDYFGDEYSYEALKSNTIYNMFNNRVRVINKIFANNLIPIGEGLMMICKNFNIKKGYPHIPYRMFDEIEEFVRKNFHRTLQILDIGLHRFCMEANNDGGEEYRKWFNRKCEPVEEW